MAKKTLSKKKKDNSLRNSAIAFCAAFCVYALIFGLSSVSSFIVGGLASLLAAVLIKIMTAPMKGIDAPGNSAGIQPDNVQDEYARSMVVKGLELLEELRGERDAISEHVFTRRINEFADGYADLLNRVVADSDKATHLRKLNSYYIPTAIKLLQSYRDAKGQGTSYMQISSTRDDLLKTIDQLIEATRVLQQKMVQANLETMDIKIEVLEDILRADGFIEDEETSELRASAEAAAAQIPLVEQLRGPSQPFKAVPKATEATASEAIPVQQPLAPKTVSVQKQPASPKTIPVQKQPEAPQTAPLQQPAAVPSIILEPLPVREKDTPPPVLKVNVPTASAQQLEQGAPVLQAPVLFPQETSNTDKDQSVMY